MAVSADGFSRISSGRASLPTSWSRPRGGHGRASGREDRGRRAIPNRQRGDQRGRMAPVVVGYGVRVVMSACSAAAGRAARRRSRAPLPSVEIARARDPGVVAWLGEDVDLVAPERLRRVQWPRPRPGRASSMWRLLPRPPGHAEGDSHLDGELVVDPEPRPADQHAQLVGERGRVLSRWSQGG